MNIRFEANDPDLAARVANAIAEAYIHRNFELRVNLTKDSASWLTEKLGPLKTALVSAEQRLQSFRERENLVDVEGVRSLIARELDEITADLVEARKRRSETENLLMQVRGTDQWGSIPAILNHRTVQEANNSIATVEKKIAELSKRYGPEHPVMLAAQSELSETKRNSRAKIDNVLGSIQKDYEVATQNENALTESMERAKLEVQNINRKEYRLKELEREVETNRKLYDTFFSRFQEANVTQDFHPFNARISDKAEVPIYPAKPRKKLIVVLTFMCALMLGVFIAFFLEFLNNGFRNMDDVERLLQVPGLGVLPKLEKVDDQDLDPVNLLKEDAPSDMGEFVRTIRSALLFTRVDELNSVTLITSALPGEGKSTTAGTLAVAMGQLKKVLLIEADMRRPGVSKQFGVERQRLGLSDLVAGTANKEECIVHLPEAKIDLLTAGQVPPNPLELISSQRFVQTIQQLDQEYDHIVIDSPPVNAVSDALIIARQADQVVFVVRAETTAYNAVKQAIQRLQMGDVKLAGIVLNYFDLKKASTYYGYHYYNRYGAMTS